MLPAAPVGSVVVSSAMVRPISRRASPDGYYAVEELGLGRSVHHVPEALTDRITTALSRREHGHRGPGRGTPDAGTRTPPPGTTAPPYALAPVLTVSTVTGTARRAAELAERRPTAAAEAMEGFGVAEAAAAHGVPVVEIRAVSNAVGPRDRAAWRIGEALGALRHTFELLSRTVLVEPWEPS
ncbi:futalosine hydrolase [Streptomyces tanashiensis]